MADRPFDEERSEAFGGRMMDVLNGAGIVLMTSIGHQTGLFDAMAGLPPATSQQIAAAAGLEERYVREWLGAMVTGGVVDYDPATGAYALPPEHAAWLTRAAGTNNLAVQAQVVPLLAEVEQPLIDCFRRGGGVPYAAFPRFQQLMAEDSGAVHDAALIEAILPLAPGLPERLAGGIDVADIGCGRGHAINLMARAFPNSHFVGYDFSEEGVRSGREEAHRLRVDLLASGGARVDARSATDLQHRFLHRALGVVPGPLVDVLLAHHHLHHAAAVAELQQLAGGSDEELTAVFLRLTGGSGLQEIDEAI